MSIINKFELGILFLLLWVATNACISLAGYKNAYRAPNAEKARNIKLMREMFNYSKPGFVSSRRVCWIGPWFLQNSENIRGRKTWRRRPEGSDDSGSDRNLFPEHSASRRSRSLDIPSAPGSKTWMWINQDNWSTREVGSTLHPKAND